MRIPSHFYFSAVLTVLFYFGTLPFVSIYAQEESVVVDIKGAVGDVFSRQMIPDAEVELMYFNPKKSVKTDENGEFQLTNVPLGRHRILVRAQGYQEFVTEGLVITAGKAIYLKLYLDEVLVDRNTANSSSQTDRPEELKKHKQQITRIKDDAVNTMIDVSSQTFSLDEVNRYSGSRSDHARLVTGFAGIMNADDVNNDIIARGATSLGVQWRLEGMPIGNPNHFGAFQTSAGTFPIININMIDNSDFLYGNLSAEYGNSTSGTFDLNFRKGSVERFSTILQTSVNGTEVVLEGPIHPLKKQSFLVSARYSILRLIGRFLTTDNVTALPLYVDLNFNLYLADNRKRQSSIFGVAGYFEVFAEFDENTTGSISVRSDNVENRTSGYYAVLGWKHLESLSKITYWKTTLGANTQFIKERDDIYFLRPDNTYDSYLGADEKFAYIATHLNSFINTKLSYRWSLRAGLSFQYRFLDMYDYSNHFNIAGYHVHNTKASNIFSSVFSQFKYKFSNRFKIGLGIHAQYASLNQNISVEPRISAIWDPSKRHRLAFGYAMQSSELPGSVTYGQLPTFLTNGNISHSQAFTELDFLRNHYLTLEYNVKITEFLQLELMPYYRFWTSIPISAKEFSGYSFVNYDSEHLSNNLPEEELESAGTSTNYGVDLSIKKAFYNNYYLRLNLSYLNANYKGSDRILRPSGFSRHYIGRVFGGKEFFLNKRKNSVFFINTTLTYAHGGYATPIDLEQSANYQIDIYSSDLNSIVVPDYIRWDVKLGMRLNSRRKRISHYFYIDIMNVLGRSNVYRYYYNARTNTQEAAYQLGTLPDILYRIQF